MNYDFDELTPDAVRSVGFRERYRGYDPADVDPLLEQLSHRVEELHEQLGQLEYYSVFAPARRQAFSPDNVAALAAMLHIGFAAREARAIVTAARKSTGLTRAKPDRQLENEERARALLNRPTSVD